MLFQNRTPIPAQELNMFWWAFAVRGGLAGIFAMVLFLASSLLGIFFFDPVTLVTMSLLLGSFVLGNGLLLGISGFFAYEHRLHLWWLMFTEACVALLLGAYIGITLMMTARSLAFLAGLHAVSTGTFQAALAVKLRRDRGIFFPLGLVALISVCTGIVFLDHIHQAARHTTQVLSGFEWLCAITWVSLSWRLRK